MTTNYEHDINGRYNETVAIIDGRQYLVNTQYDQVDCIGEDRAGGLDGIDVAVLIEDARINGKFGPAPVAAPKAEKPVKVNRGNGWCKKCQTWSYGSCDC